MVSGASSTIADPHLNTRPSGEPPTPHPQPTNWGALHLTPTPMRGAYDLGLSQRVRKLDDIFATTFVKGEYLFTVARPSSCYPEGTACLKLEPKQEREADRERDTVTTSGGPTGSGGPSQPLVFNLQNNKFSVFLCRCGLGLLLLVTENVGTEQIPHSVRRPPRGPG